VAVCNKQKYASEENAKQGALKLRLKFNLSVYECPVCPVGTWHLTKAPQREVRKDG
jgi:hypothetical protein